ncbi:uncharacterized protein ANIA_11523 [Aspergillus nidulans FGSC A4]|uniref:Uncharacterized protein n=1 Tax=Emericella nidulans (strain FGSC A4 / ATCC 38163 / CBS 112.46 / NRRL 194 / M139) TaxID=227321 RepID=C8V1D4_EMENI|nr:hypothetical protein [Aspergillus nidulans FGSC A4]CBF71169.1 TPA: hypothetical protein ANIA_11523 [Aspergillus nidulans FGSC A4]
MCVYVCECEQRAKYLAPVFSVAQPSTKPNTATALALVICHVGPTS